MFIPKEVGIVNCPGCHTRPCKCAELRKAKLARHQQEQAAALLDGVADAVKADSLKKAQEAAKRRATEEEYLTDKLLRVLSVDYTWGFEGDHLPIATVGGFRFSLGGDYEALILLRRCPACQKDVQRVVTSLLVLDDSNDLGWPHSDGKCMKPPDGETAEQRLLQALREFIADDSYQG